MSFGVNLAGFSRAEMGLGESLRSLAKALDAVSIPFSILNLHQTNPSRHEDLSWAHRESREIRHDVSIINVLPDVFENERPNLPPDFFRAKRVIGYGVWELPQIPENWRTWVNSFSELWVPSKFAQDAFSLSARIPVIRIPHAIDIRQTCFLSREELGLPSDRFLFLCTFDPFSIIERKNPFGTLEAFQSAFPTESSGVGLVIKINNPDGNPEVVKALEDKIQGWPGVFLAPEIMSAERKNSLLAAVDCFVSLHRSEGFGYVGAESMFLDKPCILTGWSGNTDYMVEGGAYAVRYELTPLKKSLGPYEAGRLWAEPDLSHASSLMRRVFDHPDEARATGRRGGRVIREEFSPKAVGSRILARFHEFQDTHFPPTYL